MTNNYTRMCEAVVAGRHLEARELTRRALDGGDPPARILDEGLLAGMAEVGRLFREEEYYVPEVLLSARAMRMAMEVLRPALAESGVEPRGRVALGTVKGDLHDIGKDLVGMMLEGGGFRVHDLGKDVAPADFVAAVERDGVQVLGLSALLTTTMVEMESTITALREKGLRERVKVIVGGAPVTPEYAEKIGADGYGRDAATAVDLVNRMIRA